MKPDEENADVPFPCYLCGKGPDFVAHVYGDCEVGLKAKKHFGLLSSPPRDPKEELTHWLLGFKCDKKSDDNVKTVVLGWAIWCESRKRCFDTPEEALQLIVDRAEYNISEIIENKNKKSTKNIKQKNDKKRINRENNFREIDQLLSSLPTSSTIIFTDGSANPNPGPCGAGIYVIAPAKPTVHDPSPPPLRYEISVALGHGTNNKGEVWALGMANQAINELDRRGLRVKGDTHVFPDSKYAMNNAEGTIKVSNDISLCLAVRNSTAKTRKLSPLTYHWVAGHNGIDGNERADCAADKGTRLSAEGKGLTKPQLKARIHNGTFYTGSLDDYLDYG
jgi:ribonuclease HI